LKATTKLLDETRSILATERDERKELLAKKDELEQMVSNLSSRQEATLQRYKNLVNKDASNKS